MAKDARTITGTVRAAGKLFREGDEDDLQASLTAEQIKRLTEKGVISGFGGKAVSEESASEPDTAAKKKK